MHTNSKGDLMNKYLQITDAEHCDSFSTNYKSLCTNITECLERRLTEKRKNWKIAESEERFALELQSLVEPFDENITSSAVPLKYSLHNLSELDIHIAANSIETYRKYFGLDCVIYNSTDRDFCGAINFPQFCLQKSITIKVDRQNKYITTMQHAEDEKNVLDK